MLYDYIRRFFKVFLPVIMAFCILIFFKTIVFAQVVINEFSVEPNDRQDWVELYSPDAIDISNWKIGDESGIFDTVPQDTNLGPGTFYIAGQYQRLNNDEDTIFLYDADGVLKDSIEYGGSGEVCVPNSEGSIARIPDGSNTYDRVKIATKNSSNNLSELDPCPTPTPEPTDTPTPTSKPTNSPTASPTPKPINTPIPKFKATSTPKEGQSQNTTETLQLESYANKDKEAVLGSEDKNSENSADSDENLTKKVPVIAVILIVAGVLLMGGSFYPLLKKRKKRYNFGNDEKEK